MKLILLFTTFLQNTNNQTIIFFVSSYFTSNHTHLFNIPFSSTNFQSITNAAIFGKVYSRGVGVQAMIPHLKVKLYGNQTNTNGTEGKTQFSKKVNYPKSWIILTEIRFRRPDWLLRHWGNQMFCQMLWWNSLLMWCKSGLGSQEHLLWTSSIPIIISKCQCYHENEQKLKKKSKQNSINNQNLCGNENEFSKSQILFYGKM